MDTGTIIAAKMGNNSDAKMLPFKDLQKIGSNSKSTTSSPNDNSNLMQYLSKSIENYNNFFNFLTQSLALENLLFYTKVVILRHNLWKLREKCAVTSPRNTDTVLDMETFSNPENKYFKHGFGLTFEYLPPQSITNEVTIESIKYDINYVYNEYIGTNAPNSVNISYDARSTIITFMNDNPDTCLDNIDDIESYLILFDKAGKEIWKVLQSVFRYQYTFNLDK